MWLRDWCLNGMRTGEFWYILLFLFLTHIYLVAAVEQDRLRRILPQRASNLYVVSLMLPFFSLYFFVGRPFPGPFSLITGFLLAFTLPTMIFVRAPKHYGFRKPLVWLSRFMALVFSLLLIVFNAVISQ